MRRRILLLVVGMTTLVVLAFAIPLAILIRHNAYDDAITDLKRKASETSGVVFSYSFGRYTEAQLKAYVISLNHSRSVSVELPSGTVIGTPPPGLLSDLPALPEPARGGPASDNAPGPGRGDPPPTPYRGGSLIQIRNQIGTPFADSTDIYIVRLWASDDALRSGQTTPLLLLAGASVLLLLVGIGAGEVLTRRIVRPLSTTADTAQRLAAGDASARAPTTGPREVADVGHALNRLADRIDELIAEERETVADLSHRLRTPLTALRLDAEALRDPAEAERVGTNVTALERMLTAVIHAARRPQREGRLPSCDASEVVGDRVAFWSALTEDQGRIGTVDVPGSPLPVRAGAEDLAAAVDALLENVIAHTPEGTAFAVRLNPNGGGAVLEVSDDGPGLPADEPVRGRSDRGSSGLGLDIARRCAESSGGSMTLGASTSGGARIALHLGAP